MGRRSGPRTSALVGSLCLGLLAADARAVPCHKDIDCDGGLVCDDVQCAACRWDAECPGGLVCDRGRCSTIPRFPPGTGGVLVVATIPGKVYLDGWPVGRVANTAFELGGIAPGSHEIWVETDDKVTVRSQVTVSAGQ